MVFIVIFFVALIIMFISWLVVIWMRMNSGQWNKTGLISCGVITIAGIIIAVVCLTLALT